MPDEMTAALTDIASDVSDIGEGLFVRSGWYTLIVAAIAVVVSFVLIKLTSGMLRRSKQGNIRFFSRLVTVGIVAIAAATVLLTIKPLQDFSRTLLAGSGLLAVVIGLAAQTALGNVLSGISLGVSRPFVVGETIEIVGQDITGIVTEIGLRQTVIRDLNNKRIAVPNSVMDQEIIRSIHHGNDGIINYLFVSIGYGSDVEAAVRIVCEAALAHPSFYDRRTKAEIEAGAPRQVYVRVVDLTETSVQLRADIWSKDAGSGFSMLSDLRLTILKAFEAEGIERPYLPPVPR